MDRITDTSFEDTANYDASDDAQGVRLAQSTASVDPTTALQVSDSFDVSGGGVTELPSGASVAKVVFAGEDLALVQPDGTAILLIGGASADGSVSVDGEVITLDDLRGAAAAAGSDAMTPTLPPTELASETPAFDVAAQIDATDVASIDLPEGTDITNPIIVGNDIYFVQPDGSAVVITNGANSPAVINIGGVPVPLSEVAVAAQVFESDSQTAPAAGPETGGEQPGGDADSSGGTLAPIVQGNIGPGIEERELLDPTLLGFPLPENEIVEEVFEEDEPNLAPTITVTYDPPTDEPPEGYENLPQFQVGPGEVSEAGLPQNSPPGTAEHLERIALGLSAADAAEAVDEDGDPLNGSSLEFASGFFNIDSPDGVASFVVNGVEVVGAGAPPSGGVEVEGDYGTLTVFKEDGEYFWVYQLTTNLDHSGGEPIPDEFSATVTDPEGDSASADFAVQIVDDSPILVLGDDLSERFINESVGDDGGNDEDFEVVGAGLQVDAEILFAGLAPNEVPGGDEEEGEVLGASASELKDILDFEVDGFFLAGADDVTEFGIDFDVFANVNTNLRDSQTGLDISLVKDENGDVRGVIYVPVLDDEDEPTGEFEEVTVFAIRIVSVEDGDPSNDVFVAVQYRALLHDKSAGEDEQISLENDILEVQITVTDGDGSQASASIELGQVLNFIDDVPVVDASATSDIEVLSGELGLEVDETTDAQDDGDEPAEENDDRYNAANAETEGGSNANTDDEDGHPNLGVVETSVVGTDDDPGLAGLFNFDRDYGSDKQGEDDIVDVNFVYSANVPQGGIPSSLVATGLGAIALVISGDGKTLSGMAGDTLVFTIEIVDVDETEGVNYQLRLTQYEAIDHDLSFGGNTEDGAANDLFDEVVSLFLGSGAAGVVQLEGSITVEDSDEDTDTASDTIDLITQPGDDAPELFKFDDDGPIVEASRTEETVVIGEVTQTETTVVTELEMQVLDESIGNDPDGSGIDDNGTDDDVNGVNGPVVSTADDAQHFGETSTGGANSDPNDGLVSSVADLFTNSVDHGSDGLADGSPDVSYDLVFTSGGEPVDVPDGGVLTNLTVTALSGVTGDRAVILTADANTGGLIGKTADGFVALRIYLDDDNELVIEQVLPFEHSDNNDFDSVETLAIVGAANSDVQIDGLSILYTVTATDGDSDVASATALYEIAGEDPGSVPPTEGIIKFEDDGPVIGDVDGEDDGVGAGDGSPISVNLDETTNPDGNGTPDGVDVYGSGDSAPFDNNGDVDDADSDDPGAAAIGRLTVAAGDANNPGAIAGLFEVGALDAGTDGEKSRTFDFKFVVKDGEADSNANGIETTMSATQPAPGGNPGAPYANATIYLFVSDNVIEGRVGNDASGPLAFSITLNEGAADVLGDESLTVEQFLALDHDDDGTVFDTEAILSLVDGSDQTPLSVSLRLDVTLTDNDDDSVTGSHDVTLITEDGEDGGDAFSFDDDGPRVDLVADTGAEIRLDETDNDSDDGDVGGILATNTVTLNDLTVEASNVFDAGTDGEASRVFSLTLDEDGADSTLVDTATMEGVFLFINDDGTLITAKHGTDADDADANGETVFTISINPDTGAVTVTQLRAIKHDESDDFDESADPEMMPPDLIGLKVVLTDGDADNASDEIELGSVIKFEDDGLEAKDDTDSTETGPSAVATGNVITGTENPDGDNPANNTDGTADVFGVDGEGEVIAIQSITASGLVINLDDGEDGVETISGSFGTLTIYANGDYSYDPNENIDFGGQPTVDDVFSYQVTDGDGDIDAASLTITITNGAPVLAAADGKVDEDGLDDDADDNAAGDNDPDGPDSDTVVQQLLDVTDSDLASVDITLTYDGNTFSSGQAVTGLTTADGQQLYWHWSDSSDATTGSGDGKLSTSANPDAGTTVATLTVDGGNDTFALLEALEHDAPPAGTSFENNILLTFNALATDDLGNTGTASFDIDVDDDSPVIQLALGAGSLQTDDGDLEDGNEGDGSGTDSASSSTLFTVTTEEPGADGDGGTVYSLHLDANTSTGLVDTLTGEDIVLVDNGGVIEGRTDGTNDLVFSLTINSGTGEVTLLQERAIDHDVDETAPTYSDDVDSLGGIVYLRGTLSDGDGDSDFDQIDIGGKISFTDDGPDIQLALGAGSLQTDDGDLEDGNEGDGSGTDSASSSTLFTVTTEEPGADGDGGTVYSLHLDADVSTDLVDTLTGEDIVLVDNGGVIEGRTDGTNDLVFSLTINSGTGEVTLLQERAIDHDVDETAPTYSDDVDSLGGIVYLRGTLSDGDGDSDFDQIDIGGKISFTDDGPDIQLALGAGSLQTDDGDLEDGNEGDGSGTDSASSSTLFTVTTEEPGADGDGGTVYSLHLDADVSTDLVDTLTGEDIVLVDNGGVIEGRTDGTNDLVFSLTINSGTGEVTLLQERAIDHDVDETAPTYSDDVDSLGGIVYLRGTLSDGDGDSDFDQIDIGGKISFTDDGPDIQLALGAGSLQTDDGDLEDGNEGDGSGTDSASSSTLFTVTTEEPGADGDGGTVYSLHLDANTSTGLVDTLTGEDIVLVDNGGVIEGRTDGTNDLVFSLTINSGTGEVTLLQERAIDHDVDETAPTYSDDVDSLGGIVYLRGTLSDGDGDSDFDQIDIGGKISFTDDGPDIQLALGAGSLQTDDGDLEDGNEGDGSGTDSASSSTLFTVTTEEPGADGDGGTVYSLHLDADVSTDLVDTLTGEDIVLVDNGGVIEGRTDGTNDLVFSLTINSGTGEVTLLQERAIDHDVDETAPTYSDDVDSLGGIVYLRGTLSDGDGDSDFDQIDIGGKISFTDDGPDIQLALGAGSLQTDDGDLEDGNEGDGSGTDSASSSTLFTVTTEEPGADGDGGTVYSLHLDANTSTGLVDTLTGEDIVLVDNGGVIEGRTDGTNDLVFSLTINSGTGEVTLLQERAIDHDVDETAPTYSDDVDSLGGIVYLRGTLSDGDGDSDFDQIDIGGKISFTDDGPDIQLALGAGSLQTDDGDLEDGNEGDGSGTDSASSSTLFTVTTEEPGADGDGGTVYSLHLDADVSTDLVDTLTGEDIVLVDNGGVIEGRTDGTNDLVFSLTINSGTGEVTLLQERAIDHDVDETAPTYSDDVDSLGGIVYLRGTLSDGDGDSDFDQIDIGGKISFTDDGPDIQLALGAGSLQTDDGDLEDGNEGDGSGTDSASSSTLFTVTTEEPGADGDGGTVYSLHLDANTSTGLVDTLTGEDIVLVDNGGVIEGRTDGTNDLVFSLTINSGTGEVTLLQERAIDHDVDETAPTYSDDVDSLGGIVYLRGTLSDGDGDSDFDQIDIGGKISFTDDGPDIQLALGAGSLQTDDGDLEDGNEGDGSGTDSASSSTLFTVTTEEPGADGDGGTVYSLHLDADVSTDLVDTLTGEDIVLVDNGGVIEGRTDGTNDLVFSLTINSGTGEVTLLQERAIDHDVDETAPTYSDDVDSLGGIVYLRGTLSDGDGDSDFDQIDIGGKISFTDDGPDIQLALGAGSLQTDDGDLEDGNEGDGSGTDSASSSTLFTVTTEEPGADGDGGTVYSLHLDADVSTDLVDTLTGEDIVLVDNGGVIEGRTDGTNDLVFSLTINSGTGEVTLLQERAIDHDVDETAPTYSDDVDSLGGIVYLRGTLSDGDGDSDFDQIDIGGKISFTDDGPDIQLALGAGSLQTDDGDLEDGNEGDGSGTDSASSSTLFTVTTEEPGADGDGGTVYSLHLDADVSTDLVDTLTGEDIVLVDNGGVIEGRTDGTNDLVFSLTINSGTGEVTLLQERAIDHDVDETAPTYSDDVDSLGGIVYLRGTLSDGDGDSDFDQIDIGGKISFTDDGPAQNNATETVLVHEDALDNGDSVGNRENPNQTTTAYFTTTALMALVAFGADGAGAFSLDLVDINGDPTGLTSKDVAINWNVNGSTLEGVAGSDVIFTLVEIPQGDAAYTDYLNNSGDLTFTDGDQLFMFELLDQVDNDSDADLTTGHGESHVESVDVSAAFIATDGDGDSITLDAGSAVVNIENDAPVPFFPEHAYVVNNGVSGSGDADGPFQINFAQAVGADEIGNVVFDSSLNGITLTDADGGPVTAGGESITLALSGGGTVLTGTTATGNVFVITITGDTYTVDLGEIAFDDGTVLSSIDIFDEAENPGKFLFNQIDDLTVGDDEIDILVSGSDQADTGLESTNISQQGTGIGSQGVGEDQTIRFDFGEEFVRSNTGSGTGSFTTTGAKMVTTAAVGISQTNPNGQEAVVLIEAMNTSFSFSGGQFDHNQAGDVSNFLTETAVEITHVVLNGETYDVSLFSNGDPIGTDGHLIYLVDVGGDIDGVYITGLTEGDVVGVQASDPFTRLAVTNGSDDNRPGGGTFADGDFANTFDISDLAFLLEGQAGEPIDLTFDVVGTDTDGDMIPGDIDVTVVPDDANNIVGDESANVLNGTTGDDLIAGNAGADTISGDAGDDILAGGLGADSITTGADADVVVFNAAELAEATSGFGGVFDLLTDFSQGFDNVDLTDLFTVDNSNGADGDDVSDFVRLVSEGGVEYLQVDANGGSDEADFVTIAQFGLDMTAVGVIFSDADDPDGVNQQSVIL